VVLRRSSGLPSDPAVRPLAVQLYAGDRYPSLDHWEGASHVPCDAGDGPRPELLLALGAAHTPLYWTAADSSEHASNGGPGPAGRPEFEYLYGGKPSYAPAPTLVTAAQALDAIREFSKTNGQRPAGILWQHGAASTTCEAPGGPRGPLRIPHTHTPGRPLSLWCEVVAFGPAP
jgi:hypothetical protein